MKQNFTQDLLLLHLYNETTADQKATVARELARSEDLQAELYEMKRTRDYLSTNTKSPSLTSLRIIMEYSHKTERLQEI